MIVLHAADAAQQSQLVQHGGLPREQLAKADARQPRRNAGELAAILAGRLGLGIPRVDVAGAAREHDINHRLGPARRRPTERLLSQQIGQSETGQPQTADAQKLAAAYAVTQPMSPTPEREHAVFLVGRANAQTLAIIYLGARQRQPGQIQSERDRRRYRSHRSLS